MEQRNQKVKMKILLLGGIGFALLTLTSCMGEVTEKLKKAKEGVSNASTWIDQAQQAEGKIERLKEMEPLNNQQLKEWLPKKINEMQRTAFKVGHAGYAGMNSVEGIYTVEGDKKTFKVQVMDGAGPTGSVVATGFGLFGSIEVEEENEYRHQQTVFRNDIKIQQTYKKQANDTDLVFALDERYMIIINSVGMDPNETWEMVEGLNLDELSEMAE